MVCILTHTFPRFEGDTISSIFMAELAQSLVDAGNDVWVLTPFTPGFKKQAKDYKVVTYRYIFPDFLHKLGYSETLSNDMSLPLLMWFLSPFMYLFGFIALLKLIRKEKIDLINAHWILPNGFIACMASIFTGVPVVSTLPGSDVYMARKNLLFNLLAKFAAWRSKWITSNSGELISDLEKVTRVEITDKSSVIPYGIGSKRFRPDSSARKAIRKSLNFSDKDIIVLGVGRLVEKKGFKYLIKVASRVVKKNKNVSFVLIGDGDLRQDLENIVKKLYLEKHFKFLGNISYEEMNGYYNMSDIFVLPSIRDSKGNLDDQSVAVMDAMGCGKPVITTNFLGYREIIENGKEGFLVKQKDVKGITRSLERLIASKSLRTIMGYQARKKISTKFSWKFIGGKYTGIFNSLV